MFKLPAATRPTTSDVVQEELWTRVVARTPMNRPETGLAVSDNRVRTKLPPSSLKPLPSRQIESRNRYRATINAESLIQLGDCLRSGGLNK